MNEIYNILLFNHLYIRQDQVARDVQVALVDPMRTNNKAFFSNRGILTSSPSVPDAP